jgi:hypothetical protein
VGEGIINLYLEGFQNPQGMCNNSFNVGAVLKLKL